MKTRDATNDDQTQNTYTKVKQAKKIQKNIFLMGFVHVKAFILFNSIIS